MPREIAAAIFYGVKALETDLPAVALAKAGDTYGLPPSFETTADRRLWGK